MQKTNKSFSQNYELVGKLIKELKLRKYSYRTGKKYRDIVIKFLKSGKTPKDFLLSYSNKSRSTMRGVYFALKFFYENMLHKRFDEKLPIVKSKPKLPIVLNKDEILRMFEIVENTKHKVVLALLYYAGLRVSEVRKIRWEDIDFEREIIHVKQSKGEKRTHSFST